jgi:trimeric autotransporter adhesin
MAIFNRATMSLGGDISSGNLNDELNNLINTLNNLDAAVISWTNLKATTITPGANIAMGGFILTGLGAGTTAGNSVRYEQVLLLTGGTMSGAIAMGSNKITGLANGTAATDAAAFGQMKVLQTVATTSTTGTSTTSTSFVNTNLAGTITPTSASNRVLILVNGSVSIGGTSTGSYSAFTVKRGSTNLGDATYGFGIVNNLEVTGLGLTTMAGMNWVDSPATTSATTYTVQILSSNALDTVTWGQGSTPTSMTLMEVV